MTRYERAARSAAKKLAAALLAIERYDDDPQDVIDEARAILHYEKQAGHHGAAGALAALEQHYSPEGE